MSIAFCKLAHLFGVQLNFAMRLPMLFVSRNLYRSVSVILGVSREGCGSNHMSQIQLDAFLIHNLKCFRANSPYHFNWSMKQIECIDG